MYRNILPYNRRQDNSQVQGHNDTRDRSRLNDLHRESYVPLTSAIHASARRVHRALRRSMRSRSTLPSMSWWD